MKKSRLIPALFFILNNELNYILLDVIIKIRKANVNGRLKSNN